MYLDMTIGEQMSWHNKQPAIMYHGMFHISQRPMSCLANIGEAKAETTASATNEQSSADDNDDWRKPIIDY
jgi:hypothetical protein